MALAVVASPTLLPSGISDPSTSHPARFSELLLPGNGTIPINHIVIVMQENHVYDTYFGEYCQQIGPFCDVNGSGIPPGTCVPFNLSNLSQGCQPPYLAAPAAVTSPVDLVHDWAPAHEAYDNGSMDGFYLAEGKQLSTFLYYNGGEIPTYWDLAEQYGLGDNFFASVLSYSTPNHWYLLAGASPTIGINQTLHRSTATSKILTADERLYLNESNATPTIASELANSSVSWKYYDYALSGYNQAINQPAGAGEADSAFDFWNPLAAVASSYTPAMKPHFVASSAFFTDAASGSLPNVSWVLPSFNNSDHPPSNLNNGEGWVASIVNAVEASPDWNSTAIFVTWDDYGGYYDHVPAPPLDADGVSFRAPLLVISPYARQGYISHQFSYFESLLHFIEWRFHLAPLTLRDANAPLPLDYFDFNATPRAPLHVPGPATATYPARSQGLGPPRAPVYLSATPGAAGATLNWSLSAAGAAVTTYQLTYGPASDPTLSTVREDGNLTTVTISNLLPGVPYQFSLSSITGTNASAAATAVATPLAGYSSEPPGQPATWTALPGSGGVVPAARTGAGFAYDAADHAELLFGGANASGALLGDTWEDFAGHWVRLVPTHSPSARAFGALTYDSTDGEVLLFGGQGAHGVLGDTWKFVGGAWTNITSVVGKSGPVPSPRAYSAMTDNPSGAGALLFGGKGGTGVLGDTWRFTKGHWSQVTVKSGPVARWGAAITFDAKDGYPVLADGNSSSGTPLNDTWKLVSGTWHLIPTPASPGPRVGATMVYDAVDQFVVLFGGARSGAFAAGTWRFLSGGWSLLSPTAAPGPRQFASAAFDSFHNGVLLGFGANLTAPLADLWEFGLPLSLGLTSSQGFGDAPIVETFYPTVAGGMVPYHFAWEFGDGTTSTLIDATHIYRTPGRFLVNLTVTDSGGASVATSQYVSVDGPLTVTAGVGRPSSNGTMMFTSSVAGGDAPYQYSWSFGDGGGAGSTEPQPTYQYRQPGAYLATVQMTDSDGQLASALVEAATDTGVLPVVIRGNVTAGTAPLLVLFNATVPNGTGPYSYAWDFGDATPGSTNATPAHNFSVKGTFVVSVNLTNSSGAWGTSFLAVTVVAPLGVHVSVAPGGPAAPDTLRFDAGVTGGQGPYALHWLFGDGGIAAGSDPVHEFPAAGTYTVVVTATDRVGAREDVAFTVSPPESVATPSPTVAREVPQVAAPAAPSASVPPSPPLRASGGPSPVGAATAPGAARWSATGRLDRVVVDGRFRAPRADSAPRSQAGGKCAAIDRPESRARVAVS